MEDTIMSSAFERLKARDSYLGVICPAMNDHYTQKQLAELHALESDIWGNVGFNRGPAEAR